jgi:hypothetical protein
MRRFRIPRLRMVLMTLGCAILIACLYPLVPRGPGRIPGWVAIGEGMSKSEAELLYQSNYKLLHGLYWRRVRADLAGGRFKLLVSDVRNGVERIYALDRDVDGFLVVGATNRLGGSCTIRCPPASLGRIRAKGLWKLQSVTVDRTFIRSGQTKATAAVDIGQPIHADTNRTASAFSLPPR